MGYDKLADPYRYIRAPDYFSNLNSGAIKCDRVENVKLHPDQFDSTGKVIHEGCNHGRAFLDDKGKIFIIQFARPKVFRVRFHPEYNSLDKWSDRNSRNLVQDTLTKLIDALDKFENLNWEVACYDGEKYVILESRDIGVPVDKKTGLALGQDYHMRIYVRKINMKMIAIRPITRYATSDDHLLNDLGVSPPTGADVKIVWQSKARGIAYSGKTTVIEVEKPGMARYLGFGEQGGRQLLKTKVILDYFNYDNMTYSQVYGQGPLDHREPLYHSEPFWFEIAQHPGYTSKVATFVDNFSQVCLDIGTVDNSATRVLTRFNSMQLYVVAGDSISDAITSYTSIVGRPRLKPRYVLGNHQGCYGYDEPQKIWDVVNGYRNTGIPLDGMHIDVDVQRNYKTFTINEDKFPNPGKFLGDLRGRGVKCSTNITPFINGDEDPNYATLNEGIAKEYFVKDHRYLDEGGPSHANEDRYHQYEGGGYDEWQAARLDRRPKNDYRPEDRVELIETWNTGKPFRGGVYYGANYGRPGHYPDLNRKQVREWWGRQYQYLIDCGLEFVWQDMTTPSMGVAYGDMRSFPFRLMLTADAYKTPDGVKKTELPAIQLWALYAFNLHKATYHGWNHNPKREGKRNFIVGRGGYIGLHRFAGLWTGDNSSTWDFMKVSVAQVLSLGLSGITISGGDVGGFEPAGGSWASPELVMRWYAAYSLLPWFRNHYNGKPGKKDLQEPFRFIDRVNQASDKEKWMYHATLPVCRYYVRLRYTLLQLLYDQMFNNMLTGLPIARSLAISNEDDASLFTENADFLDDEYMVGDDFLVAPITRPQGEDWDQITRTVYLPRPDSWWQCNLNADGADKAEALKSEHKGGSLIPYNARIRTNWWDSYHDSEFAYTTPMFIRFGAIIPQIESRDYVEDHSRPNPISIHVYPGHHGLKKSYDMYLDDGVSRESAPTANGLQASLAANVAFNTGTPNIGPKDATKVLKADAFGDKEAKDVYWKIRIQQHSDRGEENPGTPNHLRPIVRHVILGTVHQHPKFNPTTIYGQVYRLIIWGEEKRHNSFAQAVVRVFAKKEPTKEVKVWNEYDQGKNAWRVDLPITDVANDEYTVECTYKFH